MYIPTDRIKPGDLVDLWDRGPQEKPKEPDVPSIKADQLDRDAKQEEYDQAVSDYQAKNREWQDWEATGRKPRKVTLHSVDAKEALTREPARFALDLDGAEPQPASEPPTAPTDPGPDADDQARAAYDAEMVAYRARLADFENSRRSDPADVPQPQQVYRGPNVVPGQPPYQPAPVLYNAPVPQDGPPQPQSPQGPREQREALDRKNNPMPPEDDKSGHRADKKSKR